jgi:hypothetical protein
MSRSRNIKPGFFKNDLLAECSPLARLLFAGLWCEADREGRLEDRPKRLKADCLPYDDCDIDALLDQLAARGFIVRYVVDGAGYIAIPEFLKHQKPHVKEAASTNPAPNEHLPRQVLAPEIPERARLIPDSLIPHPDSLQEQKTAQPTAAPPPKQSRRFVAPSCPADVSPQVWEDWLTLRRAKTAPVTKTVLASARREAEKAGLSFEHFLAVWCNRGSQGLEASWLKPHERAGPSGNSQPSRQAQGVAAILGVNANDLIADFNNGPLVQGPDRTVLGELVPAEPRRLPGR